MVRIVEFYYYLFRKSVDFELNKKFKVTLK